MNFRPCIDIHNGRVKQIVGGSLTDKCDIADTNFVSEKDSAFYAALYKSYGLKGGHVIMLNGKDSPYYHDTRLEALKALNEYPQGLMVGGGIDAVNAPSYIEAGASHVIVTSYVFNNGEICYNNLESLVGAVGRDRVVLDMSCRKRDGCYYVVTDRWQKYTNTHVDIKLFDKLSDYCDEFLIHAVDVEGRSLGIDKDVLEILSSCDGITVTYAGGISSMEDIAKVKEMGRGRVDFTIGSALDIFGGVLSLEDVIACTL